MSLEKVIILEIPKVESHWSALYQLDHLQDPDVVGVFYQVDSVIYGILDAGSFPDLKTYDQWVEMLKGRFSLLNPPKVSLSKIVFVTMPVYSLKIEEVVLSINRLLNERIFQ